MASHNSLKDKVRFTGSDDGVDMEAIARAEKALEDLSVEFDGWLAEEVTRLLAARDSVKSGSDSFDELYRAAHDLKGEGDTLGYPLVTELCGLLCKLIDSAEDKSAIPLTLVDNHVDAIHIVMRDKIKESGHDTARAVIERLGEVVKDYEAHFARRKAS
jgi:chemotaxis protein histidine kinase CheA